MHPNHSLHLVQLRHHDLQATAAAHRASRSPRQASSARGSAPFVTPMTVIARALRRGRSDGSAGTDRSATPSPLVARPSC